MDFIDSSSEYRKGVYLSSMRPILSKRALFYDQTPDFMDPFEPSSFGYVTFRFRTAKNNVDYVFMVVGNERILMDKEKTIGSFDYYKASYQLNNELINYYFEIRCGNVTCCYDVRGAIKHTDPAFAFTLRPGFKTPDWAKGAVMYQIYVDRFCNGDRTNDVLTNEYQYIGDKSVRVEDWDKYPAAMGVREFYGGDLQGVLDKLDYLKDLGIQVIYFNPLFVSPSNHKYDIQDYDYIDPHFGRIVHDEGELLKDDQKENRLAGRYIDRVTNKANLEASNELFAHVVKEAHKRGIRVIIDGVFNHCGSFNKWLDRERIYENCEGYEKGAYVSAESPYHDFFRFHDNNKGKWPYNNTYDGWWGHDTLPKLNYEGSRDLYDYILRIARKWVSPPYNVDGWRLDVAADLGHSPEFNHRFWKDFRRVVKEANPEAIIIAEHYGDPSSWLQGDEWDTVMNYDAFMEPVTWFLTGMQKHSDDFRGDLIGNERFFTDCMISGLSRLTGTSKYVAMNELSNHDHSRFLTRTNHVVGRVADKGPEAANSGINKAVFREAVLIQMTWVGAPTIYYGDEAGLCGFTDPDNRRSYPWGHEDKELIEYHRELIKIHRNNRELQTGSGKIIHMEHNVLCYGRFNLQEQSIVVVNNNEDKDVDLDLRVWEAGVLRDTGAVCMMFTDANGFTVHKGVFPVIDGRLKLTMPPTSAAVFKTRYEEEDLND